MRKEARSVALLTPCGRRIGDVSVGVCGYGRRMHLAVASRI